jgi:hypothetical protein
MFKKLAVTTFIIVAAAAFLFSAGAALADDFKTLSDSTRIYDIVKSPWTQAKKAEIVSVIDLIKCYDDLQKNKWYNVIGYFHNMKQINIKRKAFLEASQQRIMLEQKMAREGTKDFGQTVYNAIITGADIWARYANNDGPIFSQLISSYDSMVLKIAEYDDISWLNPIKKMKKRKEVVDASRYAFQTARRFEQSNTFDKIKGVIDRPQGKEVINIVTGIGGLIDTIGNIFRGVSSIGDTIGGASRANSTAGMNTAINSPARGLRNPAASSYRNKSARAQNNLQTSSGDVFAASSDESYDQKHQNYKKLVKQYYEALKAGRGTEELSSQLEEIKKLKKELGIK